MEIILVFHHNNVLNQIERLEAFIKELECELSASQSTNDEVSILFRLYIPFAFPFFKIDSNRAIILTTLLRRMMKQMIL